METAYNYKVVRQFALATDGRYATELPPMPAGRWHAVIEDPRVTWRIVQEAR